MQHLIEMIEEYIKKRFGDDSLKVFRTIGAKENVSEFKIAEDLKLNINYVRNLLYKFYSNHLVYATRKKDRQKGWYIYYWTFNFKHARDLLIINKRKGLERLNDSINKDAHDVYECPNACTRFKVEEAMEQHFKCPECESILVKKENKEKESKVREDIEELEKEMELLNKPVDLGLIKEETKKKERKPKRFKKKPEKKKFAKKPIKKSKKIFKVNKNFGFKVNKNFGFKVNKNFVKKIKKKPFKNIKSFNNVKKRLVKKPVKEGVKKKKVVKEGVKKEERGFLQKLKRIRF